MHARHHKIAIVLSTFISEKKTFHSKNQTNCVDSLLEQLVSSAIAPCSPSPSIERLIGAGKKQMIRSLIKLNKTLYIGRLSFNTTLNELKESFPEAKRHSLPKDENGQCRGFGFVEVSDDLAEKYTENPPTILESIVEVRESLSTGKRAVEPSRIVYMGNLPDDITQAKIKELSSAIQSIRILRNERGVFGFADFNSIDECTEFIESNSGLKIDGKQVTLDFGREKFNQQ